MKTSIHRRISVASCWATNRIAVLDGFEQYEDSYAITQEFREWITCDGDRLEDLKTNALIAPNCFSKESLEETNDYDEMIEI